MSGVHRSAMAAFIIFFVLLLIPGLNWIIGPLVAGRTGVNLLFRKKWARLVGLLAGSALWSILSFYLLFFEKHGVVAAVMMMAFAGWTWFLLMLIFAWVAPDEPDQVSLAGRIQN